MLELRLGQGSLIILKNVLESVNDLFVSANFDFSSMGFAVQATNRRVMSLVTLHLSSKMFEHYKCDTSMSMGINLKTMANILNCARKDDTVTLKANHGADTATFIFQSLTQDNMEFEMNLIGTKKLGIPEVCKGFNADFDEDQLSYWDAHMNLKRHDAIVTMPSAEFANICKGFSSIGDGVVISVTEVGFKLSTKGGIGAANIVCTEYRTTIVKEKSVSLIFALTHLNSFIKATKLSKTVTISLTSELPVIVEYKIGEMDGYIRFFLSPNIEDDDEDDEGTT